MCSYISPFYFLGGIMKRALFLLAFLCIPSFAYHAAINCSTSNITQTYSTTYPGLPASLAAMPTGQQHMLIINPSSTRICVDTGQYSSVAPSVGGPNEHCLAATSLVGWDFLTINGYAFIRADGSNCTSTTIDVDVW